MPEFHDFMAQLQQPEYIPAGSAQSDPRLWHAKWDSGAPCRAAPEAGGAEKTAALVVMVFAALSVWPSWNTASARMIAKRFSTSNQDAQQWLDVHMHRANIGIVGVYVTAAVAMTALFSRGLDRARNCLWRLPHSSSRLLRWRQAPD